MNFTKFFDNYSLVLKKYLIPNIFCVVIAFFLSFAIEIGIAPFTSFFYFILWLIYLMFILFVFLPILSFLYIPMYYFLKLKIKKLSFLFFFIFINACSVVIWFLYYQTKGNGQIPESIARDQPLFFLFMANVFMTISNELISSKVEHDEEKTVEEE